MPRISEFYGIVIEMYFADHPPPPFHARYSVDEGDDRDRHRRRARARSLGERSGWCENGWDDHRAELEANWDRARRHEQPAPIAPLS